MATFSNSNTRPSRSTCQTRSVFEATRTAERLEREEAAAASWDRERMALHEADEAQRAEAIAANAAEHAAREAAIRAAIDRETAEIKARDYAQRYSDPDPRVIRPQYSEFRHDPMRPDALDRIYSTCE